MKLPVLFKDKRTSTIPVLLKWTDGNRATTDTPFYTTTERVRDYLNKLGDALGREPHTIDDIECACAVIEIYDDCEGGEPWKHNGLLRKTIQRGETRMFWEQMC